MNKISQSGYQVSVLIASRALAAEIARNQKPVRESIRREDLKCRDHLAAAEARGPGISHRRLRANQSRPELLFTS